MNKRLEPEAGVLYVVGTPIGNLGDLSPRASDLLKKVSVIACEDTRHSLKLIKYVGSQVHLYSFHKHNTQSRTPKFLDLLKEGKSIALISDAGLPGINDPGEQLVAEARRIGHEVICIPGPCAATTALVSSGLPSSRFCFEGFLPKKGKEREKRLKQIATEERTTIIFEAPHRLVQLLKELIDVCGENRPLQIARELTKRHEEQIGQTISDGLKYFLSQKPLGEYTLVLGGNTETKNCQYSNSELIKKMQSLILSGASAKEATKVLSEETGLSKRSLYALLHQKAKETSLNFNIE